MLAVAAVSALAAWSLSLRLEREAGAVARGGELAAAVGVTAGRLDDSVARAGLAAKALRGRARAGGAAGAEGGLGGYWRAEAEATRQLDALGALALEPGLAEVAGPLGGLRDAALSRMAAMDEAVRQAAGGAEGGAARDPDPAFLGAGLRPVAGALAVRVEEWRRGRVARSLAAAALDRRRLAAAIGAVLASALAAGAWWRRPEGAVPAAGVAVPAAGRGGGGRADRVVPGAAGGPCAAAARGGIGAGVVAEVVAGVGANGAATAGTAVAGTAAEGATEALRILLVEDNAMVRFSLEAMLSDLGHSVVAAGDAAEAMALAAEGPDVLVTDLGLPDLDGLTLAGRLRARQPSLRVVVASGRPGSAPDTVWLQKPFDLDRLRRAVEDSAPRAG